MPRRRSLTRRSCWRGSPSSRSAEARYTAHALRQRRFRLYPFFVGNTIMAGKSVVLEAKEITLAIELIELGARLQLLEAETSLSRDRLIKLYKELKGVSPPKGMLPFSTDWFMTWQPNIHSSLFINIHKYLVEYAHITASEAAMKANKLYLEQLGRNEDEE